MGAAAAASGASVASLGLKAGGDVLSGQATQAEDAVKAQNYLFQGQSQQEQFDIQSTGDIIQATGNETAAEFGTLQAKLVDVADRQNLVNTLGNISTITAAGHDDMTSPTTAALLGHATDDEELNRTSSEASINAQTAEETSAADYETQSANFALLQGASANEFGEYNAAAATNAGNIAATMGWINAGSDVLGGLGKAFASK